MRRAAALAAISLAMLAMAGRAAEYCKGSVSAEWLDSGRKMKLLKDYQYVDPSGATWLAPAGWVIDGASIPKFLWSLIGGPYEGLYRNASVVHDVECDKKVKPWRDVHRMFFNHMICSGVAPAVAKGMYWAVFQCGPRWGKEQGTRLFPCGDSTRMKQLMASVQCATEGCNGSHFALLASGASLDLLEEVRPEQWRQEPQLANFDLRQPEWRSPDSYREQQMAQERDDSSTSLSRSTTVLFGTGSVELTSKGASTLAKIAVELKGSSKAIAVVESYTAAGEENGKALRAARTEAVVKYLVSQGVDRDQIMATSFGVFRTTSGSTEGGGGAVVTVIKKVE